MIKTVIFLLAIWLGGFSCERSQNKGPEDLAFYLKSKTWNIRESYGNSNFGKNFGTIKLSDSHRVLNNEKIIAYSSSFNIFGSTGNLTLVEDFVKVNGTYDGCVFIFKPEGGVNEKIYIVNNETVAQRATVTSPWFVNTVYLKSLDFPHEEIALLVQN
ncbi:MAG: hypothetical protein SNJ77_06195 [Cytophagales bacterium]